MKLQLKSPIDVLDAALRQYLPEIEQYVEKQFSLQVIIDIDEKHPASKSHYFKLWAPTSSDNSIFSPAGAIQIKLRKLNDSTTELTIAGSTQPGEINAQVTTHLLEALKDDGLLTKIDAPQQNHETTAHTPLASVFVDPSRLSGLRNITSADFDLAKLIRLCEELNTCYAEECYLAVAMLVRATLDHVPPIFNCKKFTEVANNYGGGGRSFKECMQHLDQSSRKIADAYLHQQIRKSESLPNPTQVNFASDLDTLLVGHLTQISPLFTPKKCL